MTKKQDALSEVKDAVESIKEQKIEEMKQEIKDFAASKGEEAREITVVDDYQITANFYDADGRQVRAYSRKIV